MTDPTEPTSDASGLNSTETLSTTFDKPSADGETKSLAPVNTDTTVTKLDTNGATGADGSVSSEKTVTELDPNSATGTASPATSGQTDTGSEPDETTGTESPATGGQTDTGSEPGDTTGTASPATSGQTDTGSEPDETTGTESPATGGQTDTGSEPGDTTGTASPATGGQTDTGSEPGDTTGAESPATSGPTDTGSDPSGAPGTAGPTSPNLTEYNLTAYGGTGLGHGREPGFQFQADGSKAVHVVAQDDDPILNDWTSGSYDRTKTPGMFEGDTSSTTVYSEIPWLEPGEMISSSVRYELSYEDPETCEIEQVEVFLIMDDSTNDWGGHDGSFVFATAPLIDGVTYTVTAVDNNAGVPWDVLVCFVTGTLIETAQGLVGVENLVVGDRINTLDHGPQPIRWIGSRTVDAKGDFAPICIRKGALGNQRDLYVSPQHRLLFNGILAELYFGEPEVLVAAKHLVNGKTILQKPAATVTYYHLLFDNHEIIRSEGITSESLHPNQYSLRGITRQSRREILTLFPELAIQQDGAGPIVRPSIRKHEAALLSAG